MPATMNSNHVIIPITNEVPIMSTIPKKIRIIPACFGFFTTYAITIPNIETKIDTIANTNTMSTFPCASKEESMENAEPIANRIPTVNATIGVTTIPKIPPTRTSF